jgi:peptidoglycan/xylan/chitin deacetylase (PgdA/CDA1 family)
MPLSLTFDDGPDPRWTPRVLDALAGSDARATFFVIGPRAHAQPALVARIVAEGHRVELHCDAHERHSQHYAAWARADAERALDRLAGLGVRPSLWRTPWGDVAPWSAALADELGLRLVGWTADTHDWRGDRAATMLAAIADGLADGAIVLCHDGIGPGARRTDCEETVALVGLVAHAARERGLELTPLEAGGEPGAGAVGVGVGGEPAAVGADVVPARSGA